MPAILDFVFDLRLRVESPPTGRLRIDDAVVSRPQHAFNLSAFERQFKREDKDAGPGDPNPWKRRAATFFHAYDTAAGASLFLVVKGTTLLHERLVSATRLEDRQQRPEGEGTDCFRAALDAHLLVLEWAMESWPQYIDYLVKKTREQVSAVDDLEISELDAEDAAQLRTSLSAPVHGLRHTPRSMGPPSRGGTGLSRASTMTVATVRKVGSWLTGRDIANNSGASRGTAPHNNQMAECEEKEDADHDEHLADSFGFGSLQELNLLQDSVGEAAMTLREDLRVVRALATRYERLAKRHQELATEVAGFVEQIYVVLGELEGYQERIEALEEKLKRKAAMVRLSPAYLTFVNSLTKAHPSVWHNPRAPQHACGTALCRVRASFQQHDGATDSQHAPHRPQDKARDHVDACDHLFHADIPAGHVCFGKSHPHN